MPRHPLPIRLALVFAALATLSACAAGPTASDTPSHTDAPSPPAPAAPAAAEPASPSPVAPQLPTGDQLRQPFAAVTLANDNLYLTVIPEIGRITAFGRTGQPSLIWLDDSQAPAQAQRDGNWVNWGGDKVWPAPQTVWKWAFGGEWPPDGVIDGQAWTLLDQAPDHLTLESRVNPQLHVQVRRRIQLMPDRVEIQNTLTQLRPSPYPVCIWSVTQVRLPRFALLDCDPASPLPEPYLPLMNRRQFDHHWVSPLDSAIQYQGPDDKGTKIGTLGRWVAAVYDQLIFLQSTDFHPAAMYTDGSSLQVYQSPDYMELETLSPNQHLKPGQTITNTVTWRLLDRPPGSPEQIAQALDQP